MKRLFIIGHLAASIILLLMSVSGCKTGRESEKNLLLRQFTDFESLYHWDHSGALVPNEDKEGGACLKLDDSREYSPSFQVKVGSLKPFDKQLHIRADGWFKVDDETCKGSLVITVKRGDEQLFYESINSSEKLKRVGIWTKIGIESILPDSLNDDDVIIFYVWKPTQGNFWFDNLQITIQ